MTRRLGALLGACVLASFAFAVAAGAASATTFYVNGSTGNDGHPCTSPSEPCKTIAGALTRAKEDPSEQAPQVEVAAGCLRRRPRTRTAAVRGRAQRGREWRRRDEDPRDDGQRGDRQARNVRCPGDALEPAGAGAEQSHRARHLSDGGPDPRQRRRGDAGSRVAGRGRAQRARLADDERRQRDDGQRNRRHGDRCARPRRRRSAARPSRWNPARRGPRSRAQGRRCRSQTRPSTSTRRATRARSTPRTRTRRSATTRSTTRAKPWRSGSSWSGRCRSTG